MWHTCLYVFVHVYIVCACVYASQIHFCKSLNVLCLFACLYVYECVYVCVCSSFFGIVCEFSCFLCIHVCQPLNVCVCGQTCLRIFGYACVYHVFITCHCTYACAFAWVSLSLWMYGSSECVQTWMGKNVCVCARVRFCLFWHVQPVMEDKLSCRRRVIREENILPVSNINTLRSETPHLKQPKCRVFSQGCGLRPLKFFFKVVRSGTLWCQIYLLKSFSTNLARHIWYTFGLHSRNLKLVVVVKLACLCFSNGQVCWCLLPSVPQT